MRKNFKYRIYPSKKQEAKLEQALKQACFLYNQLLDIHMQVYEGMGETLSEFDLKRITQEYGLPQLHSHVKRDVATRLTRAFQNFFRRVKAGQTPGFPKFKPHEFYNSITFPDYLNKLIPNKVYLSRIGIVEMVQHRPIEGKVKTLTIKKEADEWYAVFSCDEVPLPDEQPQFTREVEGIDLGISSLVTVSTGEQVDNPKWFRATEKKLKRVQRIVSRRKKTSNNRKKAKRRLAKVHRKVTRQREDHHKKLARTLATSIKYIGVESLNISGMLRNRHLAKSISDAAWYKFLQWLQYYKTIFDGEIIEVGRFEPTSKICSSCGNKQNMPLNQRTFKCQNESCNYQEDRDINASLNIQKLAREQLLARGIKLSTPGRGETYACGDYVRPTFVFEQEQDTATIEEAGTIRNEQHISVATGPGSP